MAMSLRSIQVKTTDKPRIRYITRRYVIIFHFTDEYACHRESANYYGREPLIFNRFGWIIISYLIISVLLYSIYCKRFFLFFSNVPIDCN